MCENNKDFKGIIKFSPGIFEKFSKYAHIHTLRIFIYLFYLYYVKFLNIMFFRIHNGNRWLRTKGCKRKLFYAL